MNAGLKASSSTARPDTSQITPELVEVLRFERDVLFAGGFFLPILADPGFPAFAGGGVASGEGESGDVGIRDGNLLRGIFRDETHDRFGEGRAIATVEDLAFHARSVFAGDGDVAAIVEGLLQGGAKFGFGGEVGNPAFDLVAVAAIDDF